MKKIGYARVSTQHQNLDSQIDALREYGCDDIYQEKISGAVKPLDREMMNQCVRALRDGDQLVVHQLDRLGRNIVDLFVFLNMLNEKKIHLTSIRENVDTRTLTGKVYFTCSALVSDLRRHFIVLGTEDGLASARARGRLGGRKKKLSEDDIKHMRQLLKDPSITVAEMCRKYKISYATFYRHVGVVKPDKSMGSSGFRSAETE